MLITILGNLGSGKTLLMVCLSYYSKLKVISNFQLSFIHKQCESFNLSMFLRCEYSDCIILLDEAYSYLESRVSGSELNRIMSYMLFQSRKKNVLLYITAQLLSSIDKRYRQLSDIFIIAERKNLDFQYFVYFNNQVTSFILKFEKMLPFFDLYNTNEVISTTDNKILFDVKESNDKLEAIIEYTTEIKNYYYKKGIKSITKNLIDLYITTHTNIPKFLAKEIHSYIQLEKSESKAISEIEVEEKPKKKSKKSKSK